MACLDTKFWFTELKPFTRYSVAVTPVTTDLVDPEEKARFVPAETTFYTSTFFKQLFIVFGLC